MKNLAIIWAALCPVLTFSQSPIKLDHAAQRAYVDTVLILPGQVQSEILSRAAAWFVRTYADAGQVIEVQTQDQIAGKAFIQISGTASYGQRLWYSVTAMAKDGKARLVLDDLELEGTAAGMSSRAGLWSMYDLRGMKGRRRRKAISGRQVLEDRIIETVEGFIRFMRADDDW